MPLPVEYDDVDADTFDTSITDPRIIHQLVSQSNLRGADGAVWAAFRRQDLLSSQQKSQAWFHWRRLSQEELACLLFDVQLQILRRYNFKYSYMANFPVFMEGLDLKKLELSCLGCARSFAGLLHAFGFAPNQLKYQKSNPKDNPTIKIVIRAAATGDVRGAAGPAVGAAYDMDRGAPTRADELSNGFKLTHTDGRFTVAMVSRDPFLNHYCVFVDAGFTFPYFDPLTGGRYKNGQKDLFAAYQRWDRNGLRFRGEEVPTYCSQESYQTRIYRVPPGLCLHGSPDMLAARQKYDKELGDLWFIVDPADWLAQVPARGHHRGGHVLIAPANGHHSAPSRGHHRGGHVLMAPANGPHIAPAHGHHRGGHVLMAPSNGLAVERLEAFHPKKIVAFYTAPWW
jgi:hypothetical protein